VILRPFVQFRRGARRQTLHGIAYFFIGHRQAERLRDVKKAVHLHVRVKSHADTPARREIVEFDPCQIPIAVHQQRHLDGHRVAESRNLEIAPPVNPHPIDTQDDISRPNATALRRRPATFIARDDCPEILHLQNLRPRNLLARPDIPKIRRLNILRPGSNSAKQKENRR